MSAFFEFAVAVRPENHANARMHWRLRSICKIHEKTQTRLAWLAAGQPALPRKRPATVHLILLRDRTKGGAPMDGDNLWARLKYVRDELARCWQIDDRDGIDVLWSYGERRTDPSPYGVAVRIEGQIGALTRGQS